MYYAAAMISATALANFRASAIRSSTESGSPASARLVPPASANTIDPVYRGSSYSSPSQPPALIKDRDLMGCTHPGHP